MTALRNVAVLGATGSIGTSALDVIARHPGRLRASVLAAGSNVEALVALCREHRPDHAAIADPERFQALRDGLRAAGLQTRAHAGAGAIADLAADPCCDTVLAAIVGAAGLDSTLAAARAGKRLLLANKESLVLAGELVMSAAGAAGATVVPIDSEHSAVFQCLPEGRMGPGVGRVILTASGGPFRGRSRAELAAVTPAQAVAHPKWTMGPKISVDSATLMNKGLEVIEAHLLFEIDFDHIEVVVHPQSHIHSMVEFTDASTIAQISPPDMRLPISYALGTQADGSTTRLGSAAVPNNWGQPMHWSFEPVDHLAFPALGLAIDAGRRGGSFPAVLNAANEVLVAAFIAGDIAFTDIDRGLARALAAHEPAGEHTVDTVLAADAWAREFARDFVAEQKSAAERSEAEKTRSGQQSARVPNGGLG